MRTAASQVDKGVNKIPTRRQHAAEPLSCSVSLLVACRDRCSVLARRRWPVFLSLSFCARSRLHAVHSGHTRVWTCLFGFGRKVEKIQIGARGHGGGVRHFTLQTLEHAGKHMQNGDLHHCRFRCKKENTLGQCRRGGRKGGGGERLWKMMWASVPYLPSCRRTNSVCVRQHRRSLCCAVCGPEQQSRLCIHVSRVHISHSFYTLVVAVKPTARKRWWGLCPPSLNPELAEACRTPHENSSKAIHLPR